MRISIIGSGVVGTGIGLGLKKLGNEVIFYDINEATIEKLKSKGHQATTDLNHAIQNSEISFVSVPTPSTEEGIDLNYIKEVTKNCADVLKNKNDFHVFVYKSTIVPQTTENVIIPGLERSGKVHGKDFGVIFNPEFLTEIHSSWTDDKEFERNLFNEDRIVLGEGEDKRAGDLIEKLYTPLNIPILRRDYKTAEMIKYSANMNLIARIAISNEFFRLCNRLGVDGRDVAKIVAMDKRIGKYGSVCGKAFGGTCFQKDLKAILSFAKDIGYDAQLLEAMHNLNEEMKKTYGVRE